ncbi:hypothetical protein PAHAL_3G415900 [Panicum hallii]|uniref:Uncharacterized protein n=1 Tax=Panicum hallii TaxID=206008 RepID=A0A2S3HE60_9POAL|nr:ent-kaur-16-ene synthase, chloroplastic-like [Panicum hallii]PAN20858.1 hypothetical protein PAHAL_3G415900 [Panicum hallii]
MASLRPSSPHEPLLLLGHQSSILLGHRPGLLFLPTRTRRAVLAARSSSSSVRRGEKPVEDRIREQLLNAGPPPPPSSYDTAWVAMVPAPGSPQASRFPQCVDWILRNQRGDGSWGPAPGSGDPWSLLVKDALSSTMACVLALRTWGVGDEHVGKGLRFIGHNASFVTDDRSDTPAGFNVIFPGMLAHGIGMGLEIPLAPADVDAILRLRDTELKSMGSSGSRAFMAYVAEGLGNLLDWDQAMEYQRKNGSLFNSPATTAAAAIHNYNGRALDYLDSLISRFGSSVPTVYPRNAYSRLRMVDTLEKMGISLGFSGEIDSILDTIYSSWLAKDEEITQDMATCAMAFRLLRLHGYDVASDGLAQFSEESSFYDSVQGYLNDSEALQELYKASHVQIFEEEPVLESIGSWSAKLLKEQLCSNKISRSVDPGEVEHVLKFPSYGTVDRLEHRRNIEQSKIGGFQMLKSAYRACQIDEGMVALAADGFHSCQALYQQELQSLNSWVKVMRLDELEFARLMPLVCLLPPASTMFPSELSEARLAYAMELILVTIVDDLFDVGGSKEEMENLVTLIEKWDAHEEVDFCSETVEIVFRAVYHTSNLLGAKAAAVQNRSVIHHIAELWADLARAMMAEAEWTLRGHVPSLEEYMAVTVPSFGLGPIALTSLYLIGPELTEEMVRSREYGEMLRRVATCARLLNDLRTYEREEEQGKATSVLLRARRHGGSVEAARAEVRSAVAASRSELMRLVVRDSGAVPRAVRQEFWNICKVAHLMYREEDGFASTRETMRAANAVVHEPLAWRLGGKIESPAESVNLS